MRLRIDLIPRYDIEEFRIIPRLLQVISTSSLEERDDMKFLTCGDMPSRKKFFFEKYRKKKTIPKTRATP